MSIEVIVLNTGICPDRPSVWGGTNAYRFGVPRGKDLVVLPLGKLLNGLFFAHVDGVLFALDLMREVVYCEGVGNPSPAHFVLEGAN